MSLIFYSVSPTKQPSRCGVGIATNGQSLLLCWYFLMSSPEPLLIEKLMMKITTKAGRIPSAGYGLIAI
jgi:hypothetical protein